MSSEEHRFSFSLYEGHEFERDLIKSINSRAPKRQKEYLRHLACQGITLQRLLEKMHKSVDEIDDAIREKNKECSHCDFVLRLNSGMDDGSLEGEILTGITSANKRNDRKKYIREAILFGYWLEDLPNKSISKINQLFDVKTVIDEGDISISSVGVEKNHEAKKQFGSLMPNVN